jgi:hypothetical protein
MTAKRWSPFMDDILFINANLYGRVNVVNEIPPRALESGV